MAETMLRARPALAGRTFESDGVRAAAVDDLTWQALTLRRGQRAALATRLDAAFGLTLPEAPGAQFAGATTLLWTGADRLVLLSQGPPDTDLTQVVGDAADVTDLTGSQASVAITGPGARALLGKLVPIDLHPRCFGPGSAAMTLLGHFGVTLWQTDDTPSYRLSCYRSFATALWRAVRVAGAPGHDA